MFLRSVFNISIVCFFFHFITLHDLWNFTLTTESDKDLGEESKRQHKVVIGILSARENSELRRALRDTWVGQVKNHPQLATRVLVRFIIGEKACAYPTHKRLDKHGCEISPVKLPVSSREVTVHRLSSTTQGTHTHQGAIGVDFRVNHPVVVTRLGVFDSGADGLSGNLSVRIYDIVSQSEIVSTSFTSEDPGELIGCFRFKDVEQYVFPKGFEGTVVAEGFNSEDPFLKSPDVVKRLDNGGGLITLRKMSRVNDKTGEFPEFEETICQEEYQHATGTFMFRAHALEDTAITLDKEAQEMDWQQKVTDEQNQLLQEQDSFGDILFVPVVDVYRNIPRKMLKFYKWVSGTVDFKFLIKTDDDCFMNVPAILESIRRYKLEDKTRFWWSRFRTNWLVERQGKWREPEYSAEVYPAFACGAGSLLSSDLVHWLGKNADDLKTYQGEDVSLGIWLASIGPDLLRDKNWTCFQECSAGMYNSPQQSPNSLRQMWHNLRASGSPCESKKTPL